MTTELVAKKAQYHGVDLPDGAIDPRKIISGFANPIDPEKLDTYTRMLKYSSPPPIHGWPSIIDDGDVGGYFLSGEEIAEKHIGQWVWYVSDGHHRACAALEADVPLYVELDPDCVRQMENEMRFAPIDWDIWLKTYD